MRSMMFVGTQEKDNKDDTCTNKINPHHSHHHFIKTLKEMHNGVTNRILSYGRSREIMSSRVIPV